MFAQCRKHLVADLDVQRHLRGVLNHQLLNRTQRRVGRGFARIVFDHGLEGIEFGLAATGGQEVRCVVAILVVGAGQQGHGANAQLTKLAAGRQSGAHRAQVDVPGPRQRLTPQQCLVEVDQGAAPACQDGIDQLLRLGFEGGVPVRDAHDGLSVVHRRGGGRADREQPQRIMPGC